MSGFAAIAGPGAGAPPVREMLEAVPHRGARIRIETREGFAFGVVEADHDDPFTTPGFHADPELAVVTVGPLYSGDSAISGDRAAGEVVRRWRLDGSDGLRGSMSAVVFDERVRTATAYRSPVGEFPLFYRRSGDDVAFASEPKQLARWSSEPAKDIDALLDVVSMRLDLPERTGYEGVRRLLPGSLIDTGGMSPKQIWNARNCRIDGAVKLRDAAGEYRRLLTTAARRRWREGSAVLLSGGLDSAAVATAAIDVAGNSRVRAVSAGYPGQASVDESIYIEEIAEAYGLEIVWTFPDPKPFEDLRSLAALHDGAEIAPLSSNLRAMLHAATAAGISACLDGHDGDGVLGGYTGVVHALLAGGKLSTAIRHVGFMRLRAGAGWPRAIRRMLLPAMMDFVPGFARRRGKAPGPSPGWAEEPLANLISERDAPRRWAAAQYQPIDKLLPLSFEYLDRMSHEAKVTLTHPYADIDLVEFLLRLPPGVKFAGGKPKGLVRAALPELPVAIRERQDKTSFRELAEAAAGPAEMLAAVREAPRGLPGVDWDKLETTLEAGPLPLGERMLLGRVLTADWFLKT